MDTEPFVVTEISQLRALASPVRSQIMDKLRNGEERSVAELARLIGSTGPATHYQVGQLLNAGLLVHAGKRRTGPRSESIYRAISNKIKIPVKPESPEYMAALLALALRAIRRLERQVVESHTSTSCTQEVPAVRLIHREGRIREEDLPKLYALMEAACRLVDSDASTPDTLRLGLHIFAIQLPPEEDLRQRP